MSCLASLRRDKCRIVFPLGQEFKITGSTIFIGEVLEYTRIHFPPRFSWSHEQVFIFLTDSH